LERGLQFPRWGLLFKLMKITGLSLDDFMPMGPE
jgi:hypothetical protein